MENHLETVCFDLEGFLAKAHSIGLADETESLSAILRSYRTGEQKIVFLGSSNAGKSTLINAMLGECFLQTSMKAETALLTHIVSGNSGGNVRILEKTPGSGGFEIPEMVFWGEYQAEKISAQHPENIHHAVLQCTHQKNGLVFADTPDFHLCRENLVPMEAAVDSADAIIFVLNANRLLDLSEKEWMQQHLNNLNRRKVFFAVNWCSFASDENFQSLDLHLRNELAGILTDSSGHFSQDLYDSRVFYIDALLAENARTGKAAFEWRMGKRVAVPVPPEDVVYSGVPELEEAVFHFIRESHLADASGRCMELMSQVIRSGENRLWEQEAVFQSQVKSLTAEKALLAQKKQAASEKLRTIQTVFQQMSMALVNQTMRQYDLFVQSVEQDWKPYVQSTSLSFGAKEQARIACLKVKQGFSELERKWTHQAVVGEDALSYEKELIEIIRPVTDAVGRYLEAHQLDMVQSANRENVKIISEYIQQLNAQYEELEKIDPAYFSQAAATETLTSKLPDSRTEAIQSGSFANVLISLLFFQNTTMAYDMIFRKASLGRVVCDGFDRKASTMMVNFAIGVLTGGGYWAGMLLHSAYLAIRRVQKGENYGKEIFCSFQEPVVKGLTDARESIRSSAQALLDENTYQLQTYAEKTFREQIELAEAQLERNLTDVYSIHRNTGIETEHFQECLNQMRQIMYRLKQDV